MAKWLHRIGVLLAVIGAILYVFAKIHFFSRFGVLSLDDYFKEHYPYTLGLVVIGGMIWIITRFIDYLERDQHSQK